jgi:hypothetical protein
MSSDAYPHSVILSAAEANEALHDGPVIAIVGGKLATPTLKQEKGQLRLKPQTV